MINQQPAEAKSFDGVIHNHINLAKDMNLIQVANNMVSKKSEKKEYSG